MSTKHLQVQYREPSRAKVLHFARAVFRAETTTDSEQVSAFAAALQALLAAYVQVRNATSHAEQP